MPFINQIICKINNSLSTTSLTAGLIDGIAYQVTKKTDAGDQLFPAVFEGGLVEKYIGIDDSNSTIVYHRQIRNSYTKNQQIPNRYRQTTQMLMVVYANKNLLQVQTPDALESLIIKSFPTRLQGSQLEGLEGLDDVNISVTGSEMNPATVFSGEYRNVPYRLSPDEIYFSISYVLDFQFDNNCLDECNPSPPDSLCDFIELATAQQIIACLSAEQIEDIEDELCTGEGTAQLTDSAGNLISDTTIPANQTIPIVAPDGTINLVNTDNDPISIQTVRSNQTKSVTLPNVSWTNTDGSAESTPYGDAIVCTPATGLSVDFSADDTTPLTNQTVAFTDLTSGSTTWLWDFGDGELSTLQNPTHAYKYAGTYTVILHADDGSVGGFTSKTNYITVTLQTVYQTNLQMHNKAMTGASPSNATLVAGLISQWNDETANAYHRTQGTANFRPTYNSSAITSPDGTVYGSADYDRSNDRLINNNAAFTRTTGSYEVVLLRQTSMASGGQVLFEAGNANRYEYYQDANGAGLIFNGSGATGGQGVLYQKWYLLKIHWNGASSSVQINNNAAASTSNPGTGSAQGSTQGSTYNGLFPSGVRIVEHLVYSSKPSDADIAASIDNYFTSKFGLW